jgi:hypothetical protein
MSNYNLENDKNVEKILKMLTFLGPYHDSHLQGLGAHCRCKARRLFYRSSPLMMKYEP